MWVGTVPWRALREDARWTVSLHASRAQASGTWAFPTRPLGELVHERKESLKPGDWPEHRFTYLGLENVAGQSGELVGTCTAPGSDIRSSSKVFRPGDLLYGRLRPYLNKVYAAVDVATLGVCSGEFLVLVPDPTLARPLFLREVLASVVVQSRVSGMQFGSALPRLRIKDLLAIEVPLPPPDVQEAFEEQLLLTRARLLEARRQAELLPRQARHDLEAQLRGDLPSDAPAADEPEATNRLPEGYVPQIRRRGRPRST